MLLAVSPHRRGGEPEHLPPGTRACDWHLRSLGPASSSSEAGADCSDPRARSLVGRREVRAASDHQPYLSGDMIEAPSDD